MRCKRSNLCVDACRITARENHNCVKKCGTDETAVLCDKRGGLEEYFEVFMALQLEHKYSPMVIVTDELLCVLPENGH